MTQGQPDPVGAAEMREPADGVVNMDTVLDEVGLVFNPALGVFQHGQQVTPAHLGPGAPGSDGPPQIMQRGQGVQQQAPQVPMPQYVMPQHPGPQQPQVPYAMPTLPGGAAPPQEFQDLPGQYPEHYYAKAPVAGAAPPAAPPVVPGAPVAPPIDPTLAAVMAQNEQLAALVQSTARTLAAVAERPAAPEPPPEPLPPHPVFEKMARGEAVDPAELQAAVVDLARREAVGEVKTGFANFSEAYAAIEAEREQVQSAMRQVDPSFDINRLTQFLTLPGNELLRAGYDAMCAQGRAVEAAQTAWARAGATPAPAAPAAMGQPYYAPQPIAMNAQQAAQLAPVQPAPQARHAGAPPRGGQGPAPDPQAQRQQKLDRLAKASETAGDRSPETEAYAVFRLFGVDAVEDLAPATPRVTRRG